MSSQVVEQLVLELELELNRFRSQTQEAERLHTRLKKSIGETEAAGKSASEANAAVGASAEKSGKHADKAAVSFLAMANRLRGLFATVTSSFALERLATGIAKVNDNLRFMQQRLDMSAGSIVRFGNAAEMLGGDAQQMQAAMRGLNQSIQQLALMGDSAILPFFNALGVGVVDAAGNVRDMDDIMLDMADAFSKMDPRQAYAFASAMGLEDGVANALIQGRDAMREMLEMQDTLYVSTQAELDASRELRRNQALLRQQWRSLRNMLGDVLIPLIMKLTEGAQRFTDYLLRNERTVKNVFEGLAYVIGVVTTLALARATIAAVAMLAPFATLTIGVAALAAGFLALYDDYKTWAKGGESLFDWTKFNNFIESGGFSVRGLSAAFKGLWNDAKESIPVLKVMADVISKLIDGDFTGAFKELGNLPSVRGISGPTDKTLRDDFGDVNSAISSGLQGWRSNTQLGQRFSHHEERAGLPSGLIASIMRQEIGNRKEFLEDPAKYHYEKNEQGQRIAPHTGKESTAFGPFGILESTARDPGYGVKPLQNKSLEEQIRFMSDYVAARIKNSDGLREGLAGYGEGLPYADQILGRMGGGGGFNPVEWLRRMMPETTHAIEQGRNFSRTGDTVGGLSTVGGAITTNDINVSVGGITVNTNAATLPDITNEALGAAIDRSGNMINQMVPGL